MGQLIYTTVDEKELEELSYFLAHEDLLIKRHVTKGRFRGDNPSQWKKYLIEQSKEVIDRLENYELPVIQKRISWLDKANQEFESKSRNLLEKYKSFRSRFGVSKTVKIIMIIRNLPS